MRARYDEADITSGAARNGPMLEGMNTLICGDVIGGCSTRLIASDISGVLGQLIGHVSREHGITDIPVALIHKARASVTQ
jgi:predicted small metal-binding protein